MGFFYFYKSCFRSTFSAFGVNLGVKNGVIFRAYIPQKTFCIFPDTLSRYSVVVSVYIFCVTSNDACPSKYCLSFGCMFPSSNLVA